MQLQRRITNKRWLLGKWVMPYVQFEDAVAAFEHPCRTQCNDIHKPINDNYRNRQTEFPTRRI